MLDTQATLATLQQQLDDAQQRWLQQALQAVENAEDPLETLLPYSAMARRKLGAAVFNPLGQHWQVADIARVLLLQCAITQADSTSETIPRKHQLIHDAYRYGDELERAAILKGLSMLDIDGHLVELAINAGRTNSIDLFSAIALNNAYPAQHYHEPAFNQLVLKALFMDQNIEHIFGLDQRMNNELTRMCIDFIGERLAAGRIPPYSIWLAIDYGQINHTDKARCLSFLTDQDQRHRHYLQKAFSAQGQALTASD